MDFRKAFKGFGGATPDGNLPKINDRDAADGMYECEVVMTEAFESFESNGLSFKAEVIVHACDNGRFKPGTHASIIIHNLDHPKPFTQAKAHGNVKGLLAACLTNMDTCEGEDPVDPMDPTLPWEDEFVPQLCEKESTFIAGARFKVQTVGSSGKDTGFKYKKLNFSYVQNKKAA